MTSPKMTWTGQRMIEYSVQPSPSPTRVTAGPTTRRDRVRQPGGRTAAQHVGHRETACAPPRKPRGILKPADRRPPGWPGDAGVAPRSDTGLR
jgi:hypothetical protein